LVDLDVDGRTDVLSGSWPGEIYFFRRKSDGTFAAAEQLKDKYGKPLNVGHGSAAFAVDWDSNGTIDLIVGNTLGEVYFIPNEGKGRKFAFGAARRLEAAGQAIKVGGEAAPVAADWDGDGKLDLIVGTEDGSVVWYRNGGSAQEPVLDAARTLVDKSPLGWGGDDRRQPGDWGLRVKPCVFDWDGDGRPDLLLGDRCGGFNARPNQTEQEKAEERKANDQMPQLRRKWANAFQHYRRDSDPPKHETPAMKEKRERELKAARTELQRLKDEIVVVQGIQGRYRPGYQAHGFVWLFLRKPAPEKGP
jgi:hypothetical protein